MLPVNAFRMIAIRTTKLCSAAILAFLLCSSAFAQGGAATGDLHVTVRDPRGGLVTTAAVTVRDLAKGLSRTATVDGQGG